MVRASLSARSLGATAFPREPPGVVPSELASCAYGEVELEARVSQNNWTVDLEGDEEGQSGLVVNNSFKNICLSINHVMTMFCAGVGEGVGEGG